MPSPRLLGFLAVLALAPVVSYAQELWQGTRAGMSVNQVQKLMPKSAPTDENFVTGDGAPALLRLSGVEILGKPFDARFFFKDGKLVEVALRLGKEASVSKVGTVMLYEELETTLRAKYGNALNRKVTEVSGSTEWVSGGTTIRLIMLLIGPAPIISISYNTERVTSAAKL